MVFLVVRLALFDARFLIFCVLALCLARMLWFWFVTYTTRTTVCVSGCRDRKSEENGSGDRGQLFHDSIL